MDEKRLKNAFSKIKKDMNVLTTKINIVKNQKDASVDFQRALEEFQEMLNEKLSLEISNLRLEMAAEIQKMYERLMEHDSAIIEISKKTAKKSTKKSSDKKK